jgi:HAD superfamily hydrolase (TIGR01484 family)
MRYLVLVTDYDGTIATGGKADDATLSAIERLRLSGRRVLLLTGRRVDDLMMVCPRLDLFDYVVAENGAVLYEPLTSEETLLGEPPPARFVRLLRELTGDAIGRGESHHRHRSASLCRCVPGDSANGPGSGDYI